MRLLSYILIYVSLIWTFASSNPIPQRRRNRVEEEFLKSYFGSGFSFRANRNRNRKIDDTKDAINTSKNYATVSIVINYLKNFSRYFLHLMRCLNCWDNKKF